MTRPSRQEIRRQLAELRALVNDWDPLGVIGEARAPADEYDCLVAPVLSLLARGGGKSELSAFLRSELESHFGVDPRGTDVDAVARRLTEWFADRSRSGSPGSPPLDGEGERRGG